VELNRVDVVALREAYDAQLRAHVPDPLPDGTTVEYDGPLVRVTGLDSGGFVTYRDLDGLTVAELDALIGRQRDVFTERGQQVEWKLHGHDRPADLAERLVAHGFEPQERETVLIGPIAPIAAQRFALPAGVRLREVTAEKDLERIARMEEAVWGEDRTWLVHGLQAELAADPSALTILVAETEEEAGGEVVSAGWIRYLAKTEFVTLWGGSTLPHWRRRGIYRALVAHRARLAQSRGFSLMQVDASDDSRPILERLGLVAVTTTTPYVYTPRS
jgi:GNAT superfamily N-acetyltransferase